MNRNIWRGVLTGVAVVGTVGAYLTYVLLTTDVTVLNDGPGTVEVFNCGDPAVLAPGQRVTLQVNNYEASRCQLYANSSVDSPAGCLVLSAAELSHGDLSVRISQASRTANCPR